MTDDETTAKRILIIDDNLRLVKALTRCLQSQGFETSTAATCDQARRALRATSYDMIVMDLNLPDCDGLDLLEQIGLLGSRPPVLLTTAEELVHWQERARDLGVEAYLVKPFPLKAFMSIVRCLLVGHCCFPRCSKGYKAHGGPEGCPLNL